MIINIDTKLIDDMYKSIIQESLDSFHTSSQNILDTVCTMSELYTLVKISYSIKPSKEIDTLLRAMLNNFQEITISKAKELKENEQDIYRKVFTQDWRTKSII